MEARLTGIDRDETLRYLGWRGGTLPADAAAAVERCAALLLAEAKPRIVWRLFRLLPDGTLEGTAFRPAGEGARRLLEHCGGAILFAATLGAEAEKLLRRAQSRDMAEAVILDAAAGAAVENVCDNLCADLAETVAPRFLTRRISPGYGDWPLAQQPELCRVLDVGRRIGVSLSAGGVMTPQKTVTALLGVSDRPEKRDAGGCAYCDMFENCAYRKEGTSCGNA